MAYTALQSASKGDVTPRTWTVSADGDAVNLTGVTAVVMYYRWGLHGNWGSTSTADSSPMLVVTTPASGILTFTPTSTFFREAGVLYLYLRVDTTADYTVPDADTIDYYVITVLEGY